MAMVNDAGTATGLVVGTGDYVYDLVRPWGRLPEGIAYGEVASVAVDSNGRVYVYQRPDPPVIVLDRDGSFITAWGEGRIFDAHGICVGPDDYVYACDRDAHEVLKLTGSGELVMTIGQRGRPSLQAPFNHPADVCVADNGDIYVADGYANSRVHRFAADGKHLLSFGEPGAGPGQFTTPHAVWVQSERVYVADRENNRIQVFAPDGEYLSEWGDVYHPMDIYGDGKVLYVTDQIPRLSVFTAEGLLVARGRPSLMGAHGIWGDSDGSLYLAEVFDHRLAKLVRR